MLPKVVDCDAHDVASAEKTTTRASQASQVSVEVVGCDAQDVVSVAEIAARVS